MQSKTFPLQLSQLLSNLAPSSVDLFNKYFDDGFYDL